MVHRGRLSAACKPCRSRRLKCDQKKPSCSQCIRGKRECGGYRDVDAMRVHDQTEEVKRKNSPSAHSSSSSSTSPPQKRSMHQSDALVLRQVSAPISNQGTAFMLARWVARDGLNGLRGPVGNYIPHVINTSSGRAVTASLNATGLAALSNIHMSQELMLAARQQYITALAETNAALSDQMHSTSDATLIAVTFLGLFELLTCNGPPLMDKYLNHLEGCTRLIELRGSNQLEDMVGLGLFAQFRMSIVLSNFWLKRPTPSFLINLTEECVTHRGGRPRMDDELFLLVAKVADLCSGLRDGARIQPVKVVKEALKLDAELSSWAVGVESQYRYTVVNVPESATAVTRYGSFRHIYGNKYHVYPDSVVSSWWSDYRFARLILLELICWLCDHLARKDEATGAEYRQTYERCSVLSRQLSEDVCASVPYQLGASMESATEDLASPRTGGVVHLIWPLFISADSVGSSPAMVEWITQCLFKIGHGIGIQQALVMSSILLSGQHLTWLPDL
ncbi:hypothetical protein BJY01DRAFT_104234 [Aspergillus pseudoustus]|uniref:Zn(2)-C6 fungal-type domain-containing protein n=1 Tax=Aspergillus pseudoustus TaxID=1810923 RepID=A0ABR4KI78_9EURO